MSEFKLAPDEVRLVREHRAKLAAEQAEPSDRILHPELVIRFDSLEARLREMRSVLQDLVDGLHVANKERPEDPGG